MSLMDTIIDTDGLKKQVLDVKFEIKISHPNVKVSTSIKGKYETYMYLRLFMVCIRGRSQKLI